MFSLSVDIFYKLFEKKKRSFLVSIFATNNFVAPEKLEQTQAISMNTLRCLKENFVVKVSKKSILC